MPIGRIGQVDVGGGLFLCPLDALLDFANVVEIVVQVGRDPWCPVSFRDPPRPREPNRECCDSPACVPVVARVVPGRPNMRSNTTRGLISMGSGVVGVLPRNRVHVGTAVGRVAAADPSGEILGGHFERRKRRVLTDLVGDDLIDCDAGPHVFRDVRNGTEPLSQAADADGMAVERIARVRRPPSCTPGTVPVASGSACNSKSAPLSWRPVTRAVSPKRHEDHAETRHGFAAVCAIGVNAGTIASRNGNATASLRCRAKPCDETMCLLHVNITLLLFRLACR